MEYDSLYWLFVKNIEEQGIKDGNEDERCLREEIKKKGGE